MEDDNTAWPPAPNASQMSAQLLPPTPPKASRPHLAVILVMWALTLSQFVLQMAMGVIFAGTLLGIAGFVLAVFLVTRPEKAARVNGGLRLAGAFLGFLIHLMDSRQAS